MIEKPLDDQDLINAGLTEDDLEEEIEIEEESAERIEYDDGSMDIILDPAKDIMGPAGHSDNLVKYLGDTELSRIASEIIDLVDADKRSRSDWEKAYVEGLEYLGMKVEERQEPWPGASGVYHPLMTEAVVRFQAQTMTEIFPASGPAKVVIVGEQTDEVVEQALRVDQELNYQLTEVMTEFRPETETMLFRMALAGSAFKKIWYDPSRARPVSVFVPAEDFVVQYGASELESCERYAHAMKRSKNEIRKLQLAGLYADIPIQDPAPSSSEVEDAHSDLTGERPVTENDDRHNLYEVHIDYDLPGQFSDPSGLALPYIITVDRDTNQIYSIYRNWDETDPQRKKIMHFVHYQYMPGTGFYGLGLIHLMGGLAKSATSILRQLIDAGTLSNLPGGLKTRGLRIRGEDQPIMPGEWRDVDIPGGQLKDSMFPLPYKEPSLVLYQLLGNVIEEGRRIGSIADLQVGEMNANAPVGTTLALLERSLKVMSAVQARVHWALKNELRLISRIIRDYMPPQYDYNVGGQWNRSMDFGPQVDVIPVSDPNASTMSQRVVKYQAAIQLATTAPQLYDMAELHRQALSSLDMPNVEKIIPKQDNIPPADPVTENANIIVGKPVKAFYYQDHEAHIATHLAAVNDPKIQSIVGMSPSAPQILQSMNAHILEHVAFSYRKQVESTLGTPLPDPTVPLPPELDASLSVAVSEAADRVKQANTVEMSQKEAMEKAKDPVLQIQLAELKVKQEKLALEEEKLNWQKLKDADQSLLEREKLATTTQNVVIQEIAKVEGQQMLSETQSKEAEKQRDHDIGKTTFSAVAKTQAEKARSREKA